MGSFQVWVPRTSLDQMISWLMLNRRGHSCLIHPITRYEVLDHTERALWLGEKMPLNLGALTPDLGQAPLGRPPRIESPNVHFWNWPDITKAAKTELPIINPDKPQLTPTPLHAATHIDVHDHQSQSSNSNSDSSELDPSKKQKVSTK